MKIKTTLINNIVRHYRSFCIGITLLLVMLTTNYFKLHSIKLQILIGNSKIKNNSQIYILQYIAEIIMMEFFALTKLLFSHRLIASACKTGYHKYFLKALKLKYSSFNKLGPGIIHQSIIKRGQSLGELLNNLVINISSDTLFMTFIVVAIIKEISFLASIKILLAITVFILLSIFAHKQGSLLRKKINIAFEENSAKCLDILSNYERIITFDNIDPELKKYKLSMNNQVKYKIFCELLHTFLHFMTEVFLATLVIYILYQISISASAHETIQFIILISFRLKDTTSNVSNDLEKIFISKANLSETSIDIANYETSEKQIRLSAFNKSIKITNLNFAYDNKNVLNNISCIINKGDKIAVTGPNSSGKSTFLKLLRGFYDYTGKINIDDIEVNTINNSSLSKLFAFVPQYASLFNKSLIMNLYNENNMSSNEKIIKHAKEHKYHNLFSDIGYHKIVGVNGCNLSGGQRQKVYLLRAIIRDSPIILMDKATASMDAASKYEVARKIHKSFKSKTIVNVVDTLNDIKKYNKIFHFENKTLLENGSFKELMSKQGSFYNFYKNNLEV